MTKTEANYFEKLAGCNPGQIVTVRGSRKHSIMPYQATVTSVDAEGVHCDRLSDGAAVIVPGSDVTTDAAVAKVWRDEAN